MRQTTKGLPTAIANGYSGHVSESTLASARTLTGVLLRLICSMLLGCACLLAVALAIGRTLPQEDEFIFSSYRGYGLYRMALKRNLIAPLITTQHSLIQPDWSPDGQHIAYVNNSTAQLILYVADADGQNARIVTDRLNSSDYDPKWSPDGRFIAYSTSSAIIANGLGPVIEIMLFDSATQNKRRLITTNIFRDHMLCWSPDGTQIAFVLYSPTRANSDIYSINVQTGAIHTLVSTPANDEYPVWSPDGKSIAFVSGIAQRGIYLLDITSGQTSLLYSLSDVSYPSDWSQDSHSIFLSSLLNIYKLDVATCLENPKTCAPELLVKGGGDARRKPHRS